MEIIINFIYQLVFTVGLIVVLGLIIALCRKALYSMFGIKARNILLVTGFVGTPIHELSHALACLVFGHKIIEIKLYEPNSTDGTMGYVKHTYNPKNLYHQVGNFFIGVAPILFGSGLLLLLMCITVNGMFNDLMAKIETARLSTDLFDLSTYTGLFSLFGTVLTTIFNFNNMSNAMWWLFIVLAIMISSHMELSTADIKGGFKGFVYIAVLLLIVDVVLYFISVSALEIVTSAMASISLTIASFLVPSVVFCVITVLIGLIVKGIMIVVKK